MSISSRITEMEQHIGNAYDKIEDLGIDLTDVDKNIDNISSMLENVWNEYPKVSVTDVEEASIDGTKKGRMGIEKKAQTEQEQLTGKNLFNPNGEFENGFYDLEGAFRPSYAWKCMTLNCKQGDTFVKSGTKWGGIVTFWDNDTFVSGINSKGVTIPSGANKVKFACQYPFNGDEQLEQGTTATDYEPYCRTEYQPQIHLMKYQFIM